MIVTLLPQLQLSRTVVLIKTRNDADLMKIQSAVAGDPGSRAAVGLPEARRALYPRGASPNLRRSPRGPPRGWAMVDSDAGSRATGPAARPERIGAS